jgi:hypothetical protein
MFGIFGAAVVASKPADAAICYLRGTRIRTPAGEVEVEHLKIGDLVRTLGGRAEPIKWIGRRRYTRTAGKPWPKGFEPIRIARLALDERTPHRDLFVSPGNALYLDGVLIAAQDLVNGRSIAPAVPAGVETIEYFHLELAEHQVIFAEGAAAETLQSASGNREWFSNFADYERRYGEDRALHVSFAPRLGFNGGRSELRSRLRSAASPWIDRRTQLDRIRDRLAERAEAFVG